MLTFKKFEEVAIPISGRFICELSSFLPFAVVANAEEELEELAADVGNPDPSPAEVYEFLVAALAAGASKGRFTAVAVVLNEQPPPELDIPEDRAIHAYIDIHGTGAMSVFVPYDEDDAGELSIGTIVRVEKRPYFFEYSE